MVKIIFALLVIGLSGCIGYYFGKINTYPEANIAGRKFGFALGKTYCEDPQLRGAIVALFPGDVKYAEEQDKILKDKMVNGGLTFY